MTSEAGNALTPEQIRTAVVALQKIRPSYSPMIEFYGRIFSAQAESLGRICPAPLVIEPDLLALKKANDMPLIAPAEFPVDLGAARDLMQLLADLAAAHAPRLARAGQVIQEALNQETLALPTLFERLLDNRSIRDLSEELDITPDELGFFGYNAMFPSVQTCAAQLAAYLDQDHNKGYCPICGTYPDLAHLDRDGRKWLTCSLCSHSWPVKRMGCLFCNTQDKADPLYFFSPDEKEYRVYYCDLCKGYLKTVDTREMGRSFVPRLEQVASLHLDIKAKAEGYIRVFETGH